MRSEISLAEFKLSVRFSRSTKIVRCKFAKTFTPGHVPTSRLATNESGVRAVKTIMSIQEIWFATNNAGLSGTISPST